MLKMDVAASDVPVNLESVVDENKKDRDENKEESVVPPLKKPRFDEDTRRVAEIILVLSGLQSIRGGKPPTALEIELMAEAKSKLVDMCQQFRPKDLISRHAIEAMIEDLGLHGKLKDQRLGLTAPKLTISEKLDLGKRKMEESEKNPIVSSVSPGHSTSAKDVSMAHQLPNAKMKASTSSVNATGSHFVKDVSGITKSRIGKPHIAASHRPSVLGGNDLGNATSSSAKPHSTSSSSQPHSSSSTISHGTASGSKVPVPSSSRDTYWSIRPFMSQTPPPFGVSYGQTSSPFENNQHAEIANLIHTFLPPPPKQNLLGNELPREFMSTEITCQICQETVNDVETVLLCDVCERGYHLKCLKANNMEGIVKSTWHCPRCVRMQLNSGKSFRLTYGRVIRDATTPNKSSSTAEVKVPTENKVGKMDQKVINQEAMPHPETAKPTEDSAMEQTGEAEDTAKNLLVETATSQMVEAEEAALNPLVEAAMSQIVEAEDAAIKILDQEAMPHTEAAKPTEDSAMEQTGEAEDAAKSLLVLAEATPNVQEAVQKSVIENPQEDKSC